MKSMPLETIIVGDIHAEWGRLNQLISKKKPKLILQCGDFGWWPRFERSVVSVVGPYQRVPSWQLHGVKCKETEVRWCDGNHEDHEALRGWQDAGLPVNVYDKVYYQPRGSTHVLPDGRVVLFYGGAHSVDQYHRTQGFDWFPEELPNHAQFNRVKKLEKVDIVISHTCPIEFGEINDRKPEEDPTRYDLSAILNEFKPEQWFFGHWHDNKRGNYKGTYWECLNHCTSGGQWYRVLR